MIIIAASLYLPEHIAMMASRAWFYYAGEEGASNIVGKENGNMIGTRVRGEEVLEMLERL